ncbi:hypothetical protein HanIR_Chr03g0101331 [Helianthus annuus]|nr:hypothetical protein HanIR_Chr03g0101331 [Helianthus annuus]
MLRTGFQINWILWVRGRNVSRVLWFWFRSPNINCRHKTFQSIKNHHTITPVVRRMAHTFLLPKIFSFTKIESSQHHSFFGAILLAVARLFFSGPMPKFDNSSVKTQRTIHSAMQ